MFATVQLMEARGRDGDFKKFVDARDLPPDLQRETLEQLFRSASGDLRQRALRAGAVVLPDDVLISYLRNGTDDVVRNSGLEMLKLRGRRAFPTAVALLDDSDGDVVLQAVLVLDSLRDPRAWPHLRPLLEHPDQNVVQATIMAAGHLAGVTASRDLVPFLSADPWLQMAATQALGDLRSTAAVPHLVPLLSDEFLQQFAGEALARIGDLTAFRALAEHWLASEHETEPRLYLELLAGMLMQFERPPRDAKLLAAVERYLSATDRATATAAARCVLALGPSAGDEIVLDLIAATLEDERCPLSISGRSDLIASLIRRDPPMRDWAWELLNRFPAALSPEVVARTLDAFRPADLGALGMYMAHVESAVLAIPLMALWIERAEEREKLAPGVRRHAAAILDLASETEMTAADRIALLEATGAPPSMVSDEIVRLEETQRWAVLSAIRSREVVQRLPWSDWMESASRATAGRALADAVTRTNCRELLANLRIELAASPQRELVEAVGDLRDSESVPILAALLEHNAPLLRAAVFDSLGRIGGTNARTLLRSHCSSDGPDAGHACRALAMCATASDCATLRSAADSPDLSVRLAVIGPLIAFVNEENLRVLRRLLFDPSPAVAQKAKCSLDLAWSAI